MGKQRKPDGGYREARRQAELADRRDRARKRMDPTARVLLLGDLVLLAACQMLQQRGMLPEPWNTASAVAGGVLLAAALYFQFWHRGRRL